MDSKSDQVFQCICEKQFITLTGLEAHIRRYNERGDKCSFPPAPGKKIFGCAICDGAFSRVDDFHRHLKIMHSVDPFTFPLQCPECGKICRKGQQLMSHRRNVHSASEHKRKMLPPEANCSSGSNLPVSSGSSGSIPVIDLDDDHERGDKNMGDLAPSALETKFTKKVKRIGRSTKCGKTDKARQNLLRRKKKLHKFFDEATQPRESNQKYDLEASSSNHRQVSSRESDMYLCLCGSSFAVKASLLKHIADNSKGK